MPIDVDLRNVDRMENQPPEILSKIFEIVCGESVVLSPTHSPYPWVLGHVCSRWRHILWNTPAIWNKIVIRNLRARTTTTMMVMRRMSCRESDNSIVRNMLKTILEHTTPRISFTAFDSVEHMSDTVLDHTRRLSSLSLIEVSQDTLLRLLNLPSDAFLNLKELSLSFDSITIPIPQITTSPLNSAPKLQKVEYKTAGTTYIPALFLLPLTKLVSIHVKSMGLPPSAIYDMWRSCLCLTHCHFRISNTGTVPTSPQITLPSLEALDIIAWDFDWDRFFEPVIVPSLTNLVLDGTQIPPTPFISLISRSHCPLQLFSVYEDYASDNEVGSEVIHLLFRHLPVVTGFSVSWCLPTSAIQEIRDGALHNLERAEFYVHPEALGALLDMIDSYIDHGAPHTRNFESFDIVCYPGPGFSAIRDRYQDRYRTYEMIQGFKISVTDEYSLAPLQDDPYDDSRFEDSDEEYSDDEDYEDYYE